MLVERPPTKARRHEMTQEPVRCVGRVHPERSEESEEVGWYFPPSGWSDTGGDRTMRGVVEVS